MKNSILKSRASPAQTAIDVVPMRAALGAEIQCGDVRHLDEAAMERVRRAYAEHLVLLFRDQPLSRGEFLDFSRRFGELVLPTEPKRMTPGQAPRDAAYPELAVISNVKENGVAIGALGAGEVVWHSDYSYREVPLASSLLFAIEAPPTGGRTGFSNMYLAMETLPPALRRKIEGKTVKVDATHSGDGELRGGYAEIADVRFSEGVSHPIIRTHPDSGRNALYLGRRPYAYINGLTVAESESLLDELWAHAGQPEHCWHHAWRPADILVWDNRCIMHRRDPFDPHTRRVMYHANIKGSRPINDPAAAGCSPHPRGYQRYSARPA